MNGPVLSRRSFLAAGPAAWLTLRQTGQTPPAPEADPLWNPMAAGRSRLPVGDLDNSEQVKGIERRLKCTCPCNLDVFTCRTTDFTCEYSPAMHLEVMALVRDGKTDEEVIAAFVEKYGERVLMAPRAEGFNLAGYLVPGLAVLVAGGALALVLLRRQRAAAVAGAAPAVPSPAAPASPDELDRLRQALNEVAD